MIFAVVVVVTEENAAASVDNDDDAAATDDAVFLIKIEIDQGVVGVGSSSTSSIRYCC